MKTARQVLNADFALIWPYDEVRDIFFPEELVAENVPEEWLDKFRQEEPRTGRTTRYVLDKGYVKVTDMSAAAADFLGEPTLSFLRAIEVRSFQSIRLEVAGGKMGVLYVDYKTLRGFGAEDRRALEHFANHAALTLKRARLLGQVKRSRDAARIVAKVSTLDVLNETLETTVNGAHDALQCDIATVYVFDEVTQRFVLATGVGYRDRHNMRPPEQITQNSAPWKIIELKDKYYYPSENAIDDELLRGKFVHKEEVRSALGVQLRIRDNRVGVMFTNYRTPHRFTEDEIEDALQFAHQAAVAIRNAQLHDQVQAQAKALNALYEASKAITTVLTLQERLNRISEQALQITGDCQPESGCFSHLALHENERLRFVSASTPEVLARLQSEIGVINLVSDRRIGTTGRVAKTGVAENIADVKTDPDYIEFEPRTCSELVVPIKDGDRVIGVINVENPKPGAFSAEDQQNLEALAAQAAIAIQNALYYERSTLVAEVSREAAQLNFDEFLGTLFDHLRRIWDNRGIPIYLSLATCDEDTNTLNSAPNSFLSHNRGIGHHYPRSCWHRAVGSQNQEFSIMPPMFTTTLIT